MLPWQPVWTTLVSYTALLPKSLALLVGAVSCATMTTCVDNSGLLHCTVTQVSSTAGGCCRVLPWQPVWTTLVSYTALLPKSLALLVGVVSCATMTTCVDNSGLLHCTVTQVSSTAGGCCRVLPWQPVWTTLAPYTALLPKSLALLGVLCRVLPWQPVWTTLVPYTALLPKSLALLGGAVSCAIMTTCVDNSGPLHCTVT